MKMRRTLECVAVNACYLVLGVLVDNSVGEAGIRRDCIRELRRVVAAHKLKIRRQAHPESKTMKHERNINQKRNPAASRTQGRENRRQGQRSTKGTHSGTGAKSGASAVA